MVEGRTHRPDIRSSQCHSCDVCIRGCPAELISEYRQEGKSLRGTLYRGRLGEKTQEGKISLPPCQEACPIHQDTRGYVALIAKGEFKEALELIREVNPLPAVCGFICHHPCEEACLRDDVDHPIPIRLLKRFVSEYEQKEGRMRTRSNKKRKEKILVIGSGPAGLAAANDLRLLGYGVTIFEALPVLGGMLRVGIPEFRLPREIVEMEIDGIRQLGVEMKTNHPFRFDGARRTFRKLGFQAAFLSVGAHRSLKLNIPGERLQGVLPGVEFLKDLNLGKKVELGRKVVVIGGGNVAIDVARSVRRLSVARVEIFCLESQKEMPAIHDEVEEAKREGVKIHFQVSPIRIIGRARRVIGVEFMRSGMMKGSTFRILSDTIIKAIGQRVDRNILKELDTNPDGTVHVNPETGETSMKGLFAGGDVVTGPGWAIDAIAAGKKGAQSIHQYLS